jgi:hypothetical protein
MNFLLRLGCFLIFLSLISCVTQQKALVKTQELKQCKSMCMQRFVSCQKLCVNNCASCSAKESYMTIVNYVKYVHEEQIEGGSLMRGLKSYRDPLQCRKVTCNCYADLMTCEQSCTGIIQKQLRSVPYCT